MLLSLLTFYFLILFLHTNGAVRSVITTAKSVVNSTKKSQVYQCYLFTIIVKPRCFNSLTGGIVPVLI